MAAVGITLNGMFYDKLARTSRPGVFIGEASLTDLGVGGGPIIPPEGSGPVDPGYGKPMPPDMIWGGRPPVDPGYGRPGGEHPMPPIYYPPNVPPELQPPTPPPAGTTTPVPPPAGSAGWPVTGIVPPAYIVMQYPGVGPIYVTPPISASATKK